MRLNTFNLGRGNDCLTECVIDMDQVTCIQRNDREVRVYLKGNPNELKWVFEKDVEAAQLYYALLRKCWYESQGFEVPVLKDAKE